MADYPALPLWTDALLGDTGHLSNAEFGLYLRLLITMWRLPTCSVPNDDAWLERHLRTPAAEVRAIVTEFCWCDGNRIQQKRLARERAYVQATSERQSQRAKARWEREASPARARVGASGVPNESVPRKSRKNNDSDASRGNAALHPSGNAPTPTPTPTKKEEDYPPASRTPTGASAPPELVDHAFEAYNALATEIGIPKASKLTSQRRSRLAARLKEWGAEGWQRALDKVAGSDFCRGRGSSGWKVDLDFLLSPTSFAKVMDGRYDDRAGLDDMHSRLVAGLFTEEHQPNGSGSAANGKGSDLHSDGPDLGPTAAPEIQPPGARAMGQDVHSGDRRVTPFRRRGR